MQEHTLNWFVKSFADLSAKEMYQIFKLRQDVFVIEQDCLYADIDGKDEYAFHVLGKLDNEVVAYTRVFAKDDYMHSYCSFGRVVTSPKVRGQGKGHELIAQTLKYIDRAYPSVPCKISAQAHLESFYQQYGFIKEGHGYLEDNIPHIAMIKR